VVSEFRVIQWKIKRLQDESSVNRITHNLRTPELLKTVSSLTKDCQEQQNKLERVGKVF
jgi:hypothetical protein